MRCPKLKYLFVVVLWCLPLVSMADDPERSAELVDRLGLRFLNVEAGLFDVLRVSDIEVESGGETSPASNAIYLMLNRDQPVNYVQWLYSDDYQVLIEGGPADYYLFYADGSSERITMGRDLEAGQQMLVAAPGGTAKAIVLHDDAEYLLVGSVLSPAWSPHRARIGGDEAFVERYEGSSDWATGDRIRALVGPNFGHYVGGQTDTLEFTVQADGQVIWLGMQLTDSQVEDQFRRFASQQPGKAASVTVVAGAPQSAVARIRALGTTAGVAVEPRQ